MYENSRHLISRLTWDTAFDHKMQAIMLQERLSDWSHFHMQRELSAVFDKFCPPEQTWRIQSLELDLGTIDFENMESELPAKLRQQLNEKLTELILYSHQRGRELEILDEKRSHVQLIRYFLWHGMLPWNYQAADGSVNQILTMQLQNNPEELLVMLKESGFNAEQVRRRMAWQFNEPNMIKVIEGFEPNVGGQIIVFSNELTKIQQKETIVQAGSTTDFKKNLWFWVLNYLLTERGTVFNRIQFMKSNIMQMAAHYNMQYDQLLALIEFSVTKLSGSLSLQPDFILTLQLLLKDNKDHKKRSMNMAGTESSYWGSLEILFRDQNLRRSAGKSEEFNELVTVLSRQDPERFLILINSFGKTSNYWLPLINDLSDDTLKVVFNALKGSRSLILAESILFLNKLIKGVKPYIERNLLWYKGLMFILEHKNTSFKQTEFLQVLITVLAQKKGFSVMAMLDQLLAAEVPASLKTLNHIEIYRTLNTIFMTEVSRMSVLQDLKNTTPSDLADVIIRTSFREIQKAITDQSEKTGDSLPEGIINQPREFLEFVKKDITDEPDLVWLYKVVNFSDLLKMIGSLNKPRQLMLDIVGQFYRVMGTVSLTGISAADLQYILFKKVINAWTSGNWKLIAVENIWNELIWEACTKRSVSKTEFLNRMDQEKLKLPPALWLPLELLIDQERSLQKPAKITIPKILPPKHSIPAMPEVRHEPLKGSVSVRNAGLILLNGYLSILLTRLGLIDEQKKFINKEAQYAAIHYLQYVVTGLDSTEEHLLPLNKLLCGIPLSQPVMESIAISEAHKELIDGLITAVIGHWPSIGNCSVDGFRGNWLVRGGLLTEKEESWELSVEKRAYDLLIHKSPFSFSVVRYPWMDKPLHVHWPY